MKTCSIKSFLLTAALLPAFATTVFAQHADNRTLMTVGGDKITVNEFENVYRKNNTSKQGDPKSLNEYLDLYTNFRLKVKDARDMGLDTAASFKTELGGYRKQLAQPYLTDTVVNDKLLNEAYERMQFDLKASHILVKCNADALPKDTLVAYNKALKIRERITKGEDFAKVANETTEDPSGKTNGGDLGYFTALAGFVYPFETGAYKLQPGEVSMPVRTQFGYHLIKLYDKVKHVDITVAHIMVKTPKDMTAEDSVKAKLKIEELYKKLQGGEEFGKLAQEFSDDAQSARRGGELPSFGRTSGYPQEFKDAAFALAKNGDFSKPLKTRFGWHIIKRMSSSTIPPFSEAKSELKMKIARDQRANVGRTALINKIKNWYNFKEDVKTRDELVKVLDTTVFAGSWKAEKAAALNKVIFTLGDKKYSQKDFAAYIESHQTPREKADYHVIVNSMSKQWEDDALIEYEENRLDVKYPKFKALMDEYRDGILLFEVTDKKVWSKAVKDTVGLKDYYEKHKSSYMWGERADIDIITSSKPEIATEAHKLLEKGKTIKDVVAQLNKDSQLNINTESLVVIKGDNAAADASWKPGLTPVKTENGKTTFVQVNKILPDAPKSFTEAKGLITADYQAYLEKEWLQTLKQKYKVDVDLTTFKTIK